MRIIQTHRVRGGMQLLVQGEGRAQALSYFKDGEAMLQANLMTLERQPPPDPEDPAFQAMDGELRERAAELGTRRGVPVEALNQLIQGVDDPGAFADLVAFYLELPTEDKQGLLEILADEDRMRAALVAVERELARIEAQEDIQAKVQEELGERQREMLLREQLKQIQKELGDEDERNDVEELRERVARNWSLAEDARTEVERELKRLERTSPQSAEYQVIRTFLEWVTELPWGDRTEEKLDLNTGYRDSGGGPLRAGGREGPGAGVSGGAEAPDREGPGGEEAAGRPRPRRSAESEEKRESRGGRSDEARSSSSGALPERGRPASPNRSPGPWGGSTSGFHWEVRGTKPTSEGTDGPTWGPCPVGSSRACDR